MKKIIVLMMGLILAFSLAACGGGDAPAAGEAPSGPTELTIVGMDIAYDVTDATAAANQPIKLTFRNEGALEHNWLILGTDTEPTVATEADALAGTDAGILQPGDEKTLEFTLPAGEYTYICTVPGHAVAGMLGTLTVR